MLNLESQKNYSSFFINYFLFSKKYFSEIKIKILVQKIKNIEGIAAASIKSCEAKLYAFVEKL